MVQGSSVTASGQGDLSVLRLSGSQAILEIALHGGHVTDWTRPGMPPVIFLSPNAVFQRGKAIRGGVPICFPWFGPRAGDPRAPQHGFARVREWQLASASVTPEGACSAVTTLEDDEGTRALWPHSFRAQFTASAGRELRMALEVRNTGTAGFTFEAALHTYFAVSDVRAIVIKGLENTAYVDKAEGGARTAGESASITFAGEVDRLYLDTTNACTIEDPGWNRRITVSKAGSRSTVVWNPWREKARTMSDLGENAWTGMVCLETANAGADARALAPGEAHVLEAVIAVDPTESQTNAGKRG